MVAEAMPADAAAVLVAMARAIAHTAAYYGYDTELRQERVFALGVLKFGLAQQTGKGIAYAELNKIVQSLARKSARSQLNTSGLTRQKLSQAVHIVGIVIGAGSNARLLANVTSDADNLYRERFLREKNDLAEVSCLAD